MFEHPYYPIVYIRGYAATSGAVEDTVADPYMGFNIGSTKIRQLWTGDVTRHIFESPLVRLMKDEGYRDVFAGGSEIEIDTEATPRSIWIYRYYESVSKSLGSGDRPEIETYAHGLKEFIDSIESHFDHHESFRVYLVAHSMGGLIARCLLQNISPGDKRVDKVFTYATPHGGIDFRWVGNVPDFVQFHNTENFNVNRISNYLKLGPSTPPNSLGNQFPPNHFFSLIGTNHRDYGMARAAVGPMSDGLVQIKNAYTAGSPRTFVHRAHSGHYGIVNSEEGYQALRRFLFGNVRADAYLVCDAVRHPSAVQKAIDEGKEVEASYHIEAIVRVRGTRWDLQRRTIGDQSAIFATSDQLAGGKKIHLSSTFLASQARVNMQRQSLGFSIDLRVLVPEYVVDKKWRPDDHYEGGYLYREKINLEAVPSNDGWRLRYGLDSRTPNRVGTKEADSKKLAGNRYRFTIPIAQDTQPGLSGSLIVETSPWNDRART